MEHLHSNHTLTFLSSIGVIRGARRIRRELLLRIADVEENRRIDLARLIAARSLRRRRQMLLILLTMDFVYHLIVIVVRGSKRRLDLHVKPPKGWDGETGIELRSLLWRICPSFRGSSCG